MALLPLMPLCQKTNCVVGLRGGGGNITLDELYFILLKWSAWGSSCPSCSSTVPVHYFRDPNVQALFLIQSSVDMLQLAPKLLRGKTNLCGKNVMLYHKAGAAPVEVWKVNCGDQVIPYRTVHFSPWYCYQVSYLQAIVEREPLHVRFAASSQHIAGFHDASCV
jgi:hypothetical protein